MTMAVSPLLVMLFQVEPEKITPLRILGALIMLCGILTADSSVTDAIKRRLSREKS